MLVRLRLFLGRCLSAISKRFGRQFYFYLALLISFAVALDAGVTGLGSKLGAWSLDWQMQHRIKTITADPNIHIIDLSVSNSSIGLRALGELIEQIQTQAPKAIIFDALLTPEHLSDEDDFYFQAVIKQYDNVYLPILRGNPDEDFSSSLQYQNITSATALHHANQQATLAASLPFGQHQTNGKVHGLSHIQPDFDGKIRQYFVFEDNQGWRLPSMALQATNVYTAGQPNTINTLPKRIWLNWRAPYPAYQVTQYNQMHTHTADGNTMLADLKDSIVLIGHYKTSNLNHYSTISHTAIPSMEILATAIDNLTHHDYLKVWQGYQPYLIASLALIWLLAFAFYAGIQQSWLHILGLATVVGLAYLGLNYAHIYTDMLAPALWGILYFALAKVYALITHSNLQNWLSFGINQQHQQLAVLTMPLLIEDLTEPLSDRTIRKAKHFINKKSKTPCTIAAVKGIQHDIWASISDMLIITWAVSTKNPAYLDSAKQDADNIEQQLPELLKAIRFKSEANARCAVYEGALDLSPSAKHSVASQWRAILANAILALEGLTTHTTSTEDTTAIPSEVPNDTATQIEHINDEGIDTE